MQRKLDLGPSLGDDPARDPISNLFAVRTMADTIFSKIIRGEIPCHKVLETEKAFAFLDIGPLSRGHVLVIPKEPARTLDELSEESAAEIGRVLPKLCRAVLRATGASAYNILQNNGALAHQAVMHVHFHIIPKYEGGAGLGIDWKPGNLEKNEGQTLAQAIVSELSH